MVWIWNPSPQHTQAYVLNTWFLAAGTILGCFGSCNGWDLDGERGPLGHHLVPSFLLPCFLCSPWSEQPPSPCPHYHASLFHNTPRLNGVMDWGLSIYKCEPKENILSPNLWVVFGHISYKNEYRIQAQWPHFKGLVSVCVYVQGLPYWLA